MGVSQNVTLFYVLRDPHLRFGSYAIEIIITFCVKLLLFGLSSYVLGNVTFCGRTALLSIWRRENKYGEDAKMRQ